MKIIGTGIDIVEIARIEKNYKRFANVFASKILHDEEIKELEVRPNKADFIAKRFAVKEAFVKALGTGIRAKVHWRCMYVIHNESGKPILKFTTEFAKLIAADTLEVHISIADENQYAIAQALIIENVNKI